MPEGPQIARIARLQNAVIAGKRLRFDSPDGRSDDVAAIFDGKRLVKIEAVGKHLLYDFGKDTYLHVHLGRFGNFTEGPMPLPEPRGILRLRIYTKDHWYELRGAIAIEPYDAEHRGLLDARIGPNPLDPAAKPSVVYKRIVASRAPVGMLLMDQAVIAGVGNIYRSEALFVCGVNPWLPGYALDTKTWRKLWKEFGRVMADGAIQGRIVTTLPKDRSKPKGAVRANDRFYVYHRQGLPCRRCGTLVQTAAMGGRNVFWCPHDQPEPDSAAGKKAPASGAESRPA